jgi:hypothetical protein
MDAKPVISTALYSHNMSSYIYMKQNNNKPSLLLLYFKEDSDTNNFANIRTLNNVPFTPEICSPIASDKQRERNTTTLLFGSYLKNTTEEYIKEAIIAQTSCHETEISKITIGTSFKGNPYCRIITNSEEATLRIQKEEVLVIKCLEEESESSTLQTFKIHTPHSNIRQTQLNSNTTNSSIAENHATLMSLINTAVIEHNQPLIDQQNKTANDIQQLKQDISNLKQEVAASLSSLQTKLTETISNTIQHTLSSLQLSNPLEENEEYLITPTKKRRTRNRL